MKRKKRWLRWIAWTLLLVLCMNSAGTTVLAVSVEEENIPNINSTQEGEMRTEDFIPEESIRSRAIRWNISGGSG